jgi:hypothetical protein
MLPWWLATIHDHECIPVEGALDTVNLFVIVDGASTLVVQHLNIKGVASSKLVAWIAVPIVRPVHKDSSYYQAI